MAGKEEGGGGGGGGGRGGEPKLNMWEGGEIRERGGEILFQPKNQEATRQLVRRKLIHWGWARDRGVC